MLVKTFQSASMPEALRLVKEELGPDAMILSTKKEKKTGIFSFFRKPVYKVTAAPAPPPPLVHRELPEQGRTAKEDLENSMLAPLARQVRELREKVDSLSKREDGRSDQTTAEKSDELGVLESGTNLKSMGRDDLNELRSILRDTLEKNGESGVGAVRWSTSGIPAATLTGLSAQDLSLLETLLQNGLSEDTLTSIIEILKTSPPKEENYSARDRLSEVFSRRLKFSGALKMRKNSPRIVALVGPTGVGKTTTTAKLAAMYSLSRGNKVALITMDIFRVGAVEQLKTYSRIMGIPVGVVSTPEELEKAVESYSDCDLILIDTAGRSHKDTEKLTEMRSFFTEKISMETYLCLSVTTKDQELEEILKRFKAFDISKIIFTKIDESESFGNMINLLIKENLPFAYFTTGQRVPEDIEIATPARLADMILRETAHE